MRHKIVAGNWKMNKSLEAGMSLASEVINMVADEYHGNAQVVLGVPFTHISAISKLTAGSTKVSVAAQNCSQFLSGAYTGEISVEMLQSVGAEWVIIGHSERREYFGETDAIVHEKTKTVLAANLKPIFCCGEPLAIREGGDYLNYVKAQLTNGLFAFSAEDFSKIVIAYEPIWAIGTGLTASPEQAQEMHAALRAHIAAHYGQEIAENTSLLYGGSVKANNAKELFSCPDVDGGLVGGAALQRREFTEIVKAI